MTMPQAYPLDVTAFKAMFAAFSKDPPYSDAYLQMFYAEAGNFINNTTYGPLSCQGATPLALQLMTAHLLALMADAANGNNQGGIMISATIDKVTVTMQEVPTDSFFQYWLASTPYGRQLLALLMVKSAGGFYVPGGPGRAGFNNGFGYNR